jgi:hypothetical protein
VLSEVADTCNGLSMTVVLIDANSGELLNLNIPAVTVTNGKITLTRNVYSAIGDVRSQNIRDIAFEIAR